MMLPIYLVEKVDHGDHDVHEVIRKNPAGGSRVLVSYGDAHTAHRISRVLNECVKQEMD